jgi:hypothetical protein
MMEKLHVPPLGSATSLRHLPRIQVNHLPYCYMAGDQLNIVFPFRSMYSSDLGKLQETIKHMVAHHRLFSCLLTLQPGTMVLRCGRIGHAVSVLFSGLSTRSIRLKNIVVYCVSLTGVVVPDC